MSTHDALWWAILLLAAPMALYLAFGPGDDEG
jgi:hypothetical protein